MPRIFNRIDWLVRLVMVIALLSCLSSVFVLVQPWFELPNGIEHRAAFSEALSVALALIVGMIAITITAGIEKSEYRAQEKLNGDIAGLVAALSSIYLKTAHCLVSRELQRPNFESELKTIGEFVCSTSGFALLCWAANKSGQAGKHRPEPWRHFFYDLVSWQMRTGSELIQIVQARRPRSGSADDALALLGHLTNKDRKAILSYLADFGASISKISKILDEDPIIKAMRSPSPKAESAPVPLPSAERIEAVLAAARARGGDIETELKETLANARLGNQASTNEFNVVADYLVPPEQRSPERDVIRLPASEVIEAVMAAAKAKSSGLEREVRETLATARTGDHNAINLFNVIADKLLPNRPRGS